MTNKNLKQFLEKKLQKSFSDFLVFEEGIDVSVQIKFEKASLEFIDKNEDIRPLNELEDIIYNSENTENKLNALVELSMSGDVKAYRIIEKYKTECSEDIKDWTILAFQKSRAHIEHELSDDEKIYISSGLGGSGNKLRYFFVLTTNGKTSFSDFQKKLLTKEIKFSLIKNDSIAEKITFYDYFVSVLCLVPLQISPDTILKGILNETEKFGNFLSDEIIATNTEIFSEEKIIKLINHDPEIQKEMSLSANIEHDLDFLSLENDDFDDDDYDDFDDIDDDFDDDMPF